MTFEISNILTVKRLRRFGIGEKDIPQIFLELTFPTDTSKTAFATEQLHILLCVFWVFTI
jgi:hypothetical protein